MDDAVVAAAVGFIVDQAVGLLLGLNIVAAVNLFFMPRLRRPPSDVRSTATESKTEPLVSVLIPARNEAAVIDETVRRLLSQEGVRLELLVLDDQSDDGTTAVAMAAGAGDPRLTVLQGAPLPAGWLGKPWACEQLGRGATGSRLLFTDADVDWRPGALAAVVDAADRLDADLLTVWPTQTTVSPAERVVVPLMSMVVVCYLPWPMVHWSPWSAFAAANGQCLLFKRSAYDAVGRHEGVAGRIVEDVHLAKRVKQAGLRLRMADGAGVLACRMYRDWPTVRDGFAKNIIAGHHD
ncbi:MAG: glycosyltransferase, partial [Planctomycetia bacterium]